MSIDTALWRAIYNALYPPGALWIAEPDGDLDKFLDAISESNVDASAFLSGLKDTRIARLTPLLDTLEEEFGVLSRPSFGEENRRQNLQELFEQRGRKTRGQAEFLELYLRNLGFDVYVHINNPPVDPDKFLFEAYVAWCGFEDAYCGGEDAYCGGLGGHLLVNGDVVVNRPQYLAYCAQDVSVCGNEEAYCGKYLLIDQPLVTYTVPNDPNYWGLFFFVGGPATRNPAGELTDIEVARVRVDRKAEFLSLILRYKPMHTWAGLRVQYVDENGVLVALDE